LIFIIKSKLLKTDLIMNTLDKYIIEKIRYEYLENPKQNYNDVVKYLKKEFKISCSSDCRFRHFRVYNGQIYYYPVFVHHVNAKCLKCNERSVSEFSHLCCERCSEIDSLEYIYHHNRCQKN
jgi:hypothetical protein